MKRRRRTDRFVPVDLSDKLNILCQRERSRVKACLLLSAPEQAPVHSFAPRIHRACAIP